ncbi:MAG: recombinase RecT [Polynucleobacter sp.]
MKATVDRSSKSNKRSQALKGILEKQGIEQIPKDPIKRVIEIANPTSGSRIVTFGAEVINPLAGSTASIAQSIAQSIALFNGLIDKELARAAAGLGIDEGELKAWIDLQIDVPAKTILTILRSMQNLHLDPLCEEIGFTQYDDGQWQVFITIEGCSKLLHQHPQFNGLVFNQADTLIDGVPEWMECTIYRKDRTVPTTVREYLTEVRGENPIWQKMPRRMLRHRALQQCVRLAIA